MAIDPGTYPSARVDRSGPQPAILAQTPGETLTQPPVTHVFPFAIDASANNRSSVSSRRLYGPAVIRGFHASKGGSAAGTQGFGLGKAANSVSETNVANTTPFPFTPLFEGLPGTGSATSSPGGTVAILDQQPSLLTDADDLGIIILDAEFFLVVYIASGTTGGDDFHGYVTLLERVSPQALANFL
jgi:hypothetical protein